MDGEGDDMLVESEGILYRGPSLSQPTEVWRHTRKEWVRTCFLDPNGETDFGVEINEQRAESLKNGAGTLFGMVGMMEKHFIKARQRGGIEAAKLRNAYKGRPATILPDDVRELRQQGLGATEIAKRLNIGRASVYRVLAA